MEFEMNHNGPPTGFCMGPVYFEWTANRFRMDPPWILQGFSIASPWGLHEFPVDFEIVFNCFPMGFE